MYFDNQKMRNFENSIIDTLKNEGIEAESVEIVKNGIPCKGLRVIKKGCDTSPIIYYSQQDTTEAFLSRVRSALLSDVSSPTAMLTDPDYVRDHVYLAVQRQSKELLVKQKYLNIELIMRVMLDLGEQAGTGSVKVTPGLVEQLGIAEDELWKCASANSHAGSNIRSMAEVLGLPDIDGDQSLYVATTGQLTGGASVLYFPEIFHAFCEDHGEEACYMLPSSTEEILVLRETALDNGRLTVNDLVRMVETINEDQVDPILQLEPAVYRYSIDSDEIGVVATL
ncbi:MAG: hypothetical protein IJ198_13805 [Lachnospiraceae bacterium]|nr:hypothetical protein [Lachnospiraceae bacterium]